MKLKNLVQSPLNTTFMGVAHGVLSYYGIEVTDSILFGLSGHGFAINIHREVCPSGPYCWNTEPVRKMLSHLGIRMCSLGTFSGISAGEGRTHAEGLMRIHLDSGHPCSLVNMENQLVTGYDDSAFQTAQPWPGNDYPPKTLSFATWQELGEEIHISLFAFIQCQPQLLGPAIESSLRFAVSAWREPAIHTSEPYGFGPIAYDNWCRAIEAGFGTTHGNWWNGTVWAECRKQMKSYFCEISHELTDERLGSALSILYGQIGSLLEEVSDRRLQSDLQIEKLRKAKALEEKAVCLIETYLDHRAIP
jgi:hypothetical protein